MATNPFDNLDFGSQDSSLEVEDPRDIYFMERFNNIPTDSRWSAIAAALNDNFSKAYTTFVQLLATTSKSKGLYSTASALQSAIPNPSIGDWANVGDAIPSEIYVCEEKGIWKATGIQGGGDEINLTEYVKKVNFNSVVSDVQELQQALNMLHFATPMTQENFDLLESSGNLKKDTIYMIYE